ncbi:MAG: glycosyltransferase, partial [Sphingobacteriaceae bacterium]
MKNLAIVIPAYKSKYFVKALSSLSSQTNKNFTVYIGDDHSPEDLKVISDQFAEVLDIQYTRFPNNIGAARLVEQWNRCIALTQDEEWLWLFSDDDLLDPTCVASFYQALAASKHGFDVYRFNTCIIDADDNVRTVMPVGPTIETSEQMAYHLLLGERGNSMPDHIFSRQIYKQHNGFVFTPYAQGADWAMSILFSQARGLYTIPDAKVYWRLSGTNISSVAADRKSAMLSGHLDFIAWVLNHFAYLKERRSSLSYG